MSDDQNSTPGAGWYPDPAGGTLQRYWDGSDWTERTYEPAAVQGGPAQLLKVAEGVSSSTPFNWAIALLPLLGFIQFIIVDYRQYFADSFAVQTDPGSLGSLPGSVGTQLAIGALGWVVYGVAVLLAFFDWRVLKRRGVAQPFHWAWAFLASTVYIIGRAVVVNRRGAPAFAPMWTHIAVSAVGVVTAIAIVVDAVSFAFQAELPFG